MIDTIKGDLRYLEEYYSSNGVDIFHDEYPHFHPVPLYEQHGFGMDNKGAVYCVPERVEDNNLVCRLYGRGEFQCYTGETISLPTSKVRWFIGVGQPDWTYFPFEWGLDKFSLTAKEWDETWPIPPFYVK